MLDRTSEIACDTEEAAAAVGLIYVSDEEPGIRRRRSGKGFSYRGPDGTIVKDAAVLGRIRSLAIPPAWADVWIAPSADGHIQATGRDAKGRKQYRYHARFREHRESAKYEHMMEFARVLPRIRATVASHLGLRGLPREKVLASVVHLLESTLIRVGNDQYAKENKSFGLTTLKDRHARIEGSELRFAFKGKSGKTWSLRVRDRRIARIVKSCQDLPGQQLLQYVADDGTTRGVTSGDVNQYLREISGADITAKDFRTWAGTVLAALALNELETFASATEAKRNLRAAIERVSARLGNTPTICRKCYVHPEILNCYLDGGLALSVTAEVERELSEEIADLKPEEAAVLALLRSRLSDAIEDAAEGAAVPLAPAKATRRRAA